MDSTIKISNHLSDDVDRLSALCQEIEANLGRIQDLSEGESVSANQNNKEVVKSSLEIQETLYKKKGKISIKKLRGKR